MESEFGETVIRGLHRYVRLVIEELRLSGNAYYAQLDPNAGAYIALDRKLPGHPGCDVALVWNEGKGWALALETDSREDLVVVERLGAGILPSPRVVATFTRDAYAGEAMWDKDDSQLPVCEDLGERLAAYATATLPV
ncbi:DUF6292 family protein [Amycolatopsis azurea]|uniref:DUF6292 domain-containing protein n=1 Tax=Amycolatopsis azurea DSM 43854 TaxID=1238180 RepID=M2NMS0_9PSEU|nr:DUF6292 family protein [Amycolatopsis azurea]EMD23424.1 hypothetical protein C791_7250 [Amycolatopsis azurea DSM 43854]OOC04899.1 hypothetical protein B0293_20835 [Amycolatopsis azurea DSM 43854]